MHTHIKTPLTTLGMLALFVVKSVKLHFTTLTQGEGFGRADKKLTRNVVSMYIFQLQDKATLLTAERKKVSHLIITFVSFCPLFPFSDYVPDFEVIYINQICFFFPFSPSARKEGSRGLEHSG